MHISAGVGAYQVHIMNRQEYNKLCIPAIELTPPPLIARNLLLYRLDIICINIISLTSQNKSINGDELL